MESITTLNQRLIDHFGLDTVSSKPMFRVVWADDQTEKRLMDTSESGAQLLRPAVREVKKYGYLSEVHVLEQFVVVPDFQQEELADAKVSYEPLYAFPQGITPSWEALKFIVDTVHAAMGKKSLRSYVDPDASEGAKEERIAGIHQELFGNETETTDALRYKEGIVVPSNYQRSN